VAPARPAALLEAPQRGLGHAVRLHRGAQLGRVLERHVLILAGGRQRVRRLAQQQHAAAAHGGRHVARVAHVHRHLWGGGDVLSCGWRASGVSNDGGGAVKRASRRALDIEARRT